jgi:uncharacterized membrane protein
VTASGAPPGPTVEEEEGQLAPSAYVWMTRVLRIGLVAAVVLLLGALIAYLIANPGATSGDVLATNPILGYLGISGLAAGLASGQPSAYLTLGLLVLVATPLVRVLSGSIYFERAGERGMTIVTATVLALLLFGLLVLGPLIR